MIQADDAFCVLLVSHLKPAFPFCSFESSYVDKQKYANARNSSMNGGGIFVVFPMKLDR